MNIDSDWGIKEFQSHIELGPKTQNGSPFDFIQISEVKDSLRIFKNIEHMKKSFEKNESFHADRILYEYVTDKSFGLVWNPSYNEFGIKPIYLIQLRLPNRYFHAGPGTVAYASENYDLRKIKSFIKKIESIEEIR